MLYSSQLLNEITTEPGPDVIKALVQSNIGSWPLEQHTYERFIDAGRCPPSIEDIKKFLDAVEAHSKRRYYWLRETLPVQKRSDASFTPAERPLREVPVPGADDGKVAAATRGSEVGRWWRRVTGKKGCLT